ncbi:MAG: hypothetical protein II719_01935 [Clostridia bacterium]|nr:hypothetical protein [Clostridia bacterium]
MEYLRNGGAELNRRIRTILDDPSRPRTLRVTGCFEIEEPVLLPSDFTVILEDCHLRMAEGVYCNLFRNLGAEQRLPDRNIRILGFGEAVLDGGPYNGLSERNAGQNGLPEIWNNNLILFANVDGFSIEGLRLEKQRWWAVNLLFCRNGTLRNLDFCADDRRIEEDGSLVPYLSLQGDGYSRCYIHNADGIDLRCGCRDILIENITGFTQDDTVALTALPGRLEAAFRPCEDENDGADDICRVTIRNLSCESLCSIVRLLNQGGPRLYDIQIDGVRDTSQGSVHMDRGICAVRIGDTGLYGSRQPVPGETHHISVSNVSSRAECALSLAGVISDLTVSNLAVFDGGNELILNRAELIRASGV